MIPSLKQNQASYRSKNRVWEVWAWQKFSTLTETSGWQLFVCFVLFFCGTCSEFHYPSELYLPKSVFGNFAKGAVAKVHEMWQVGSKKKKKKRCKSRRKRGMALYYVHFHQFTVTIDFSNVLMWFRSWNWKLIHFIIQWYNFWMLTLYKMLIRHWKLKMNCKWDSYPLNSHTESIENQN